ncbi:MAG TPA: hypothetical protein VF754_04715 [Pyrinomonadaceae bacterium]
MRDLFLSLGLLALVFAAVLAGLAYEENWRKLVRVLIAAAVYLSILSAYGWLASLRRRASGGLAFGAFALAGAAAELASGWLRTGAADRLTLWLAPLAACLVGGAHWLALQNWRPLRRMISER